MKKENNLLPRNATSEFLMFTATAQESGVEIMIKDENVWLTQYMIGI